MTPERAHAYRRVLHTLKELGPSKLQAGEQDEIRDAVDSLLFCSDLDTDDTARQALADINALCRGLVDSGRWESSTAMRLADDVSQCGPELLGDLAPEFLPELKAA